MDDIRRGDIYYVSSIGTTVGSEQRAGRPAVVVSNDKNNAHSDMVEVVYLTASPKKDLPTHTTIDSTGIKSTALCEQITSISVERLGNRAGVCTEQEMARIDLCLLVSLDLYRRGAPEVEATAEEPNAQELAKCDSSEACSGPDIVRMLELENAALTGERDTYRELCHRLMDRLVERGA